MKEEMTRHLSDLVFSGVQRQLSVALGSCSDTCFIEVPADVADKSQTVSFALSSQRRISDALGTPFRNAGTAYAAARPHFDANLVRDVRRLNRYANTDKHDPVNKASDDPLHSFQVLQHLRAEIDNLRTTSAELGDRLGKFEDVAKPGALADVGDASDAARKHDVDVFELLSGMVVPDARIAGAFFLLRACPMIHRLWFAAALCIPRVLTTWSTTQNGGGASMSIN